MKRVPILLILCLVMVLALMGCTQGNRDNEILPDTTVSPMVTPVQPNDADNQNDGADGREGAGGTGQGAGGTGQGS